MYKYKYKNKKTYYQLERLVRGFSNHRRIQIMELLKKDPELSVIEIADKLSVNMKTIAEHIKRLAMSGLILKRNELQSVRHKLTKNGERILEFLRTLE
ncbi:MAG: winged helix-turn-helix transcriptional regulator [Candidatus Pacebacteria bacterium]|nr:winged helix-turn-helix transcriptional regulator [Candidatus Paceibacterota bacterium]